MALATAGWVGGAGGGAQTAHTGRILAARRRRLSIPPPTAARATAEHAGRATGLADVRSSLSCRLWRRAAVPTSVFSTAQLLLF